MPISYADYSRAAVEDVIRVRRVLDRAGVPPRRTDQNFIAGTWNLRTFGRVYQDWDENPGSPKRNLRALAIIAEIIRRFDVVAIQEIQRDTLGIRQLAADFLGPAWGVLLSDVTAGDAGNGERLAYLYDSRRVTPSGLAGEIVLPPTPAGDPAAQFDRTPFIVGFQAGGERFALLTVHIRYGSGERDRLPEIRNLAAYAATELRDRAHAAGAEESNLILLGDFNIDKRENDPLFDALLEAGLWVPDGIRSTVTTYGTQARHYDQIAWFRDDITLRTDGRAGVVDFSNAVYPELTRQQMSYRVSDHFPLWVEFLTDRSVEQMASRLGLDPNMPDPFRDIPG